MTTTVWVQIIVTVIVGYSIVKTLMKMPKGIAIGFAILFILTMAIVFYMSYFHTDVLLKWVEFLHLDIEIGAKSKWT